MFAFAGLCGLEGIVGYHIDSWPFYMQQQLLL